VETNGDESFFLVLFSPQHLLGHQQHGEQGEGKAGYCGCSCSCKADYKQNQISKLALLYARMEMLIFGLKLRA
jgi:hypothetical protein